MKRRFWRIALAVLFLLLLCCCGKAPSSGTAAICLFRVLTDSTGAWLEVGDHFHEENYWRRF